MKPSPVWARRSVPAVADAIPNTRSISLAGPTHRVADDAIAPVLVHFLLD